MCTRTDCIKAVNLLNQFYKLNIILTRKQGRKDTPSPSASPLDKTIDCPNLKIYHTLHIMAHEYAHHVDCNKRLNCLWNINKWHDKHFEQCYKDCCSILNIEYISTEIMSSNIRQEYVNLYPNNKYGLK
jgi:hypothetical protein